MYCITDKRYFSASRGDSFILPIIINECSPLNTHSYQIKQNENIYIGITEKNQSFENAIIRKSYDISSDKDEYGNILFKLYSSDTEFMKPGKYYITIKFVRYIPDSQPFVETILDAKEFFIVGTEPVKLSDCEDIYDHIIYDGGDISCSV